MSEKTEFTPDEFSSNSYKVNFPEKTSPTEAATEIIKHTTEPYLELEKEGAIEGLTIVLYGGTVNKLAPPKDYDLLILYEDVSEITNEQKEKLSLSTRQLYERFFSNPESPPKGAAYMVDYSSKQDIPHAKYAEVFLTSKEAFLEHLNEDESEKAKRAFSRLAQLPRHFFSLDAPDTEIYNSPPLIDWDRIDRAAVFCWTVAKGMGYRPSLEQIRILASAGNSKLYRYMEAMFWDEEYIGAVDHLDRGMKELFSDEEINKMEKGLEKGDGSNVAVVNKLVEQYIENEGLEKPVAERIRWLLGSLRSKVNIEDTIAESGVVLYGENLEEQGTGLFKEGQYFLNKIIR